MSLEVDADCRRAHSVTGAQRLLSARVDVLAGARSRPQRRSPRVWAEDGDSVVDVRRLPTHKLRHALGRGQSS